jgi:hypothetical protein
VAARITSKTAAGRIIYSALALFFAVNVNNGKQNSRQTLVFGLLSVNDMMAGEQTLCDA